MTRSIATFFVVVKNYNGLNDEVANFAERGDYKTQQSYKTI